MPSQLCGNCHRYLRGAPDSSQECKCDAPKEIILGPDTCPGIREVRWLPINPKLEDVPRCAGFNYTKAGREMHCSAPAEVWRYLVMRKDGAIIPRQFCLEHAALEGYA